MHIVVGALICFMGLNAHFQIVGSDVKTAPKGMTIIDSFIQYWEQRKKFDLQCEFNLVRFKEKVLYAIQQQGINTEAKWELPPYKAPSEHCLMLVMRHCWLYEKQPEGKNLREFLKGLIQKHTEEVSTRLLDNLRRLAQRLNYPELQQIFNTPPTSTTPSTTTTTITQPATTDTLNIFGIDPVEVDAAAQYLSMLPE